MQCHGLRHEDAAPAPRAHRRTPATVPTMRPGHRRECRQPGTARRGARRCAHGRRRARGDRHRSAGERSSARSGTRSRYLTQKPVALLNRIIELSSKPWPRWEPSRSGRDSTRSSSCGQSKNCSKESGRASPTWQTRTQANESDKRSCSNKPSANPGPFTESGIRLISRPAEASARPGPPSPGCWRAPFVVNSQGVVKGGEKPDQRAEQNTATAAVGVRWSEGVGMRPGAVKAGNEGRA